MVTLIDHCEGDIYEKFTAPRSAHVHLLGRAEHDRVLRDGSKLWAAMAVAPHIQGLPAHPHRTDRVTGERSKSRGRASAIKSNACHPRSNSARFGSKRSSRRRASSRFCGFC
jgi:hypothetical protein